MHFPHFDINHFINRYHDHFRCILINGEIIHRVADDYKLYEALGYSEEWASKGFVPEEYFWMTFKSPQSGDTKNCLPYLLTTYLHEVSSEFREKYGAELKQISDNCNFGKNLPPVKCGNCTLKSK